MGLCPKPYKGAALNLQGDIVPLTPSLLCCAKHEDNMTMDMILYHEVIQGESTGNNVPCWGMGLCSSPVRALPLTRKGTLSS